MTTTYLVYVDDSGDTTYRLYTGVLMEVRAWSECLRAWLDFRRTLETIHSIPVAAELHAGKFFAGRGRPSADPTAPVNTDRRIRRAIGDDALRLIGSLGPIEILTVARSGNSVRPVYAGLLDELQRVFEERDAYGLLIVDGEDTDTNYWAAHRGLRLAERRIVEDPWMQPSHGSQLVQMADFVAYAAHHHLTRQPGRAPMWNWYGDHIIERGIGRSSRPDRIVWLER